MLTPAAAGCVLLAVPAPAATHGAGASARAATVPGTPGTPQAPTVLYSEDFENGQRTAPVRLTGYTGATGQTYTADPSWLNDCNGWVAAFEDPAGGNSAVARQVDDCSPAKGGPGAGGAQAWNAVRQLAQALGILNGSAVPNDNHAVSAYTNGPGTLSAMDCPGTPLAPATRETCTGTYTIIQADVDAGRVADTATAEGIPAGSTIPVDSNPSTAIITTVTAAAQSLVKSASPVSFDRVGQVISYRFRVTNAGNVTLHSVRVLDAQPGLSAVRCPSATLAPGKAETCTATYHVTRADLDAGTVKDTATDQGDPPGSAIPVVSRPSALTIKGLPEVPVTG